MTVNVCKYVYVNTFTKDFSIDSSFSTAKTLIKTPEEIRHDDSFC